MRDLNRYVTRKYATDWEDIGIELGLDLDVLNIIANDNPLKSVVCLRNTLDKWLKSNTDDVTWKTLEIAITNVNRSKLGLNPVNDVYGKDVHVCARDVPMIGLPIISVANVLFLQL